MEAWFAAAIPRAQFLQSHATLAEPELSLGRVAREDDVRELLNLLADGCVGSLPDA